MIRYTHSKSERLFTPSPVYEETTLPNGKIILRMMFVSTLSKSEGDRLSQRLARLLNLTTVNKDG